MGGYVAEKMTFNDLTTGASNDLQVASKIARALVTQYGMSDKLGPITFAKSHDMVFLGKELTSDRNYSEAMALRIDEEVKRFLDEAHRTAARIVTTKKKLLKKIADALVEKETLEQEEFYALLKA